MGTRTVSVSERRDGEKEAVPGPPGKARRAGPAGLVEWGGDLKKQTNMYTHTKTAVARWLPFGFHQWSIVVQSL